MNFELNDKVVIVTGGAKGIGEAITRSFAGEGAQVCIFGRNVEEGATLVRELAACGQKAESFGCELTDEVAVRAAVVAVMASGTLADCRSPRSLRPRHAVSFPRSWQEGLVDSRSCAQGLPRLPS